jgi:hypothetical protein
MKIRIASQSPWRETSSSGSQMDRNARPRSGAGVAAIRSDRAKATAPTTALHWYALILPPPR